MKYLFISFLLAFFCITCNNKSNIYRIRKGDFYWEGNYTCYSDTSISLNPVNLIEKKVALVTYSKEGEWLLKDKENTNCARANFRNDSLISINRLKKYSRKLEDSLDILFIYEW